MVGVHENLNGLRGLPIATCYDQPIYQISSHNLHPTCGYDRLYKMLKMRWFGVVTGYSRTQGHWEWR